MGKNRCQVPKLWNNKKLKYCQDKKKLASFACHLNRFEKTLKGK